MNTEREQALEDWRKSRDEDEEQVVHSPPIVHIFTPEQEERYGVGPDTEKPFNPDDFTSHRLR